MWDHQAVATIAMSQEHVMQVRVRWRCTVGSTHMSETITVYFHQIWVFQNSHWFPLQHLHHSMFNICSPYHLLSSSIFYLVPFLELLMILLTYNNILFRICSVPVQVFRFNSCIISPKTTMSDSFGGFAFFLISATWRSFGRVGNSGFSFCVSI